MPLRLIAAYALIALICAILAALYLHLTRDRRSYARSERAYRRARKAAKRRS